MNQSLPIFPEMQKTVPGGIPPINTDEIILRFSIAGGELDSLPLSPVTHILRIRAVSA